ncbi:death domain-associated protein [Halobacteriales archaeon SW_10_66_29]|nr:MAG: death domain-associated protein [Halobacteriales archaeon SW_10_66_29]PSQ50540.1 MAG: death domain-associated protein [Halobacteriales archaeon SW_7_65_23]
MGFGSYDESEQKDQNVDADGSKAVNIHESDHDGEVSFETELSTGDLVDKLDEMKDDDEE